MLSRMVWCWKETKDPFFGPKKIIQTPLWIKIFCKFSFKVWIQWKWYLCIETLEMMLFVMTRMICKEIWKKKVWKNEKDSVRMKSWTFGDFHYRERISRENKRKRTLFEKSVDLWWFLEKREGFERMWE